MNHICRCIILSEGRVMSELLTMTLAHVQEQFGSAAGGAQAAAPKPHGRPGAQETGGSEKLTVA